MAVAIVGTAALVSCGSAPQNVPTIGNETVSTSATASVLESASPNPADPATDPSDSASDTSERNLPLRSINLSELCGTEGAQAIDCSGDYGNGSIQVNSRIFRHEAAPGSATSPRWASVVARVQVPCSALSIKFVVKDDSPDGTTANVRVVQENVDPVLASVGRGEIGTLDTSLSGGEFAIEANSSNGTYVRLSGTATCRV